MKRSLAIVLAMIMSMTILLSACQPAATTPEPPTNGEVAKPEPKVFRYAEPTEPPNIDPIGDNDAVSNNINNSLLEGLVRLHNGKVQPGIAESWDISPDGLNLTFHLRDAVWNDEKPVTAMDYEYSFFRLLDPAVASESPTQAYYIVNAEEYNTGKITDKSLVGIKAIDSKTLEIKLKYPTKYFLALLGFMAFKPVRQDMIEKYKDQYGSEPDKMVYNGPFVLKKWEHEASLVLEKNLNYWDKDNIKLDMVEILIVTDPTTTFNMYTSGDIDLVDLSGEFIESSKKQGDVEYFNDGAVTTVQFHINHPDYAKYFSNINFKKAIGYAIDRELICNSILKDGSTPALRYVMPEIMGVEDKYSKEYPLDYYPKNADLVKAKEYLDKALVELNTSLDKLPVFEILLDEALARRIVAEAMQDMLIKNLGLKIELKIVPLKIRFDAMEKADYGILYGGWGPDYDDPMTYLDQWLTKGQSNFIGWSNKQFDENVKFALSTSDIKARELKMFEAEKILLDEAIVIPIFFRSKAYATKDYVKNINRYFFGADIDFIYTDIEK